MNKQASAATALTSHIRRCLTALLNGVVRTSKRKPTYWLSHMSAAADFWKYPVLTQKVLDICSDLGIKEVEGIIDRRETSLSGNVGRPVGVERFSAFLRILEEPLMEILSGMPARNTELALSKLLNPDEYSATQVKGLPKLYGPVQSQNLPGLSLFLHGSMANLEYTAFSDVDDLVILRRAAWQDGSSLKQTATALAQVARGYQDIDPLQHHGHWVVTEFDLLFYDQSYMPLTVLDSAVHVVGQSELRVRLNPDLSGFIRNARSTIRSINSTLDRSTRRGGLNAFHLKGLVGEIAIMPAYLFQAGGSMMTKPEAIERAGEIYSSGALRALDWATMVREQFAPLVENRRMELLRLWAGIACPRRHQAEGIFRKYATWVDNQHPLGLNTRVVSNIRAFINESNTLVSEMSK